MKRLQHMLLAMAITATMLHAEYVDSFTYLTNPNYDTDDALVIAASQGNAAEAENAIMRGANVNTIIPYTLERPLGTAVKMLANQFYEYDIGSPSYNNTVIPYLDTISMLLKHGATILAEDFNTLAQKGIIAPIEQFSQKTNVAYVVDKSGYTPLYTALEYGQSPVALVLIAKGSDVNKAPHTGHNANVPPLQLAIEGYYAGAFPESRGEITLDVIEALIKAGASITPVILAAAQGKDRRLKELPNPLKKDLLLQLFARYNY